MQPDAFSYKVADLQVVIVPDNLQYSQDLADSTRLIENGIREECSIVLFIHHPDNDISLDSS
jgi:hypothetical protein